MTGELLALIHELQFMEPLRHFSLAGGSNLAIRFNHRKSVDIDFFTNRTVGLKGWETIEVALRQKYAGAVLFCNILNKDLGDQFCFLRALIIKGSEQIKVDMIQNVQYLDEYEDIDGIRMLSIRDIGLYKLMAASNRFAKKDIYDLDLITDHIDLASLLSSLKVKQSQFQEDHYKCLFDLDQESNPLDNPGILLASDHSEYQLSEARHSHSTDRLDILENGKTWMAAKFSWKKKVKELIANA